MKQHFSWMIAAGMIILGACQKSVDNPSQEDPKIIINKDAASLQKRVSKDGTGVITMNTSENGRKASAFAKSTEDTAQSNQYPLELIAEVAPPSYQGMDLRATNVDIEGNYAYVGYNREGATYLGGVSVFDISDVQQPKLIAEAIFPSTDISSVKFYQGKLYVSGATNLDKDTSFNSPAVVGYVTISNGIPTGDFKLFDVPGQVATDIAIANNKLYVASGSNGGLSILNLSSFDGEAYVSSEDLRAVTVMTNKIAVLSGTKGITTFTSAAELIRNITMPVDIAETQRNIDSYGDYLLVAAGKNGVQYYNSNSGEKTGQLDLPTDLPSDIDPEDVVTNGVSNNEGLFFAANGAAGLYLTKPTSDNALELLGSLDLNGSANYIKSSGNYIFVANGKGGLKIIKFTEPNKVTNSCGNNYPAYTGSSWLNVNSNDKLYYSGSAALQGVNVNDVLYFCGSMTVQNQFNINSNGVFDIHGSFAFGKYRGNTTMQVNGTWNIEGSVVIYGDLNLNSGATMNFLGSGSSITIYGKVTKNNGVTINGTFTDTENKLK
ncbi:hypothetical protein COR50_18770 [Chitinophaga caeni]|uniref:LVIVD repeat-containing protein n=1 Tax=Chitinophaga caeni TaxID=2029983 RepID=A0A291QYM7_9BACT|nr:hypothetical protein [Chitinophaga caeni]ATL49048.1 hypothetical protein COR50_18770 [Chitinophaga caeni]